jgi:phage baseplate assembly protein W
MSFDLALINNDLSVQADGKIRTVTDTPKLRQDIIKIVLTPLGSVKKHVWYGCSITEDIIGKALSDNMLVSLMRASITKSLERLKALQTTQSTMQKVSLAEMIEMLGSVDAERDTDDQRKINIVISVFSKRLAKIEELFTIIS